MTTIDVSDQSVERTTTLFERRGAWQRSWTVTSRYQGARITDSGNAHTTDSGTIVFDARDPFEPGPVVSTEFAFDDSFSEEDRRRIEAAWNQGDLERWTVEEDYLRVAGGTA